jgi:hypothetical protein
VRPEGDLLLVSTDHQVKHDQDSPLVAGRDSIDNSLIPRMRFMTPIVLVPGLSCSAEMFAPQIAALWPQGPVTVASTLVGETIAEIAAAMLFHSVAMLSWSLAIVGNRGWRLAAGAFGIAGGISSLVAIAVLPPRLGQQVLLGGIALLSFWYLALAGLLAAPNAWAAPQPDAY